MKIAILGYGEQGRAAYEYWNRNGNNITVCDQNESVELPANVDKQLGKNYLHDLEIFDLIVRSPSVHPSDISDANSSAILDKVTTVTDEFFRVCPTKNIIGVTGTKGKGTTSTLIARMLEADGKTVHLGGNIGTPPLDMLKAGIEDKDWVVLELANFQLIDIKHSPHIAVCLMVVPEHMDWHPSVQEYIDAKKQLFAHQISQDIAIYYADNSDSKQIASTSPGIKIPYYSQPGAIIENGAITINDQVICKTNELKLLGEHNWQNVCAAITTVWQVTQNTQAMHIVLTSFSGLEHRLELVREIEGVKFYDDSFGTTPETAIVAIKAFTQPKVVILGGSDKGASFDVLAKTIIDNNVSSVVLIGDIASKIHKALDKVDFHNVIEGGDKMTDIVAAAQKQAKNGDVVLLSTGSASFGLFKNYKDRGEQFKSAVLALA